MRLPKTVSCVLCIVLYAVHAGGSEELRATPWPKVVSVPGHMSLDAGLYLSNDPETFSYIPELTAKAESGDVPAMYLLATMYRKKGGDDLAQAIHWYRNAVRAGDISSAIVLGHMFFPTPGMSRREFEVTPSLVHGYCWLAIGLSGLQSAGNFQGVTQERGMEATEDIDEEFLQELAGRIGRELETLEVLLLPSEHNRAVEILAAWPAELPPETALALPSRAEPEFSQPAIDEKEYLSLLLAMIRGAPLTVQQVDAMVWAGEDPAAEPVRKKTLELVKEAVENGDAEARYLLAVFQLRGIGVAENREEALSYIREQAARGNPRAYYDLAMIEDELGDDEEYLALMMKAAEAGFAHAMPMVSAHFRQAGNEAEAAKWLERAAAAGFDGAIMSLAETAEHRGDMHDIIKWMTVYVLRADDPEKAYRGRMIIAYFLEAPHSEIRKAMVDGEQWHVDHPTPAR